ncbi:hypothetical protein COU59_02965, partial [Candidatus Pacearchaeota archaeon CG10_big_fil_rev_8_21_14_0_10_34_12]
KEVGESIKHGKNIIYTDFMKLSEFSSKLSDEIITSPEETLSLMELAIEESGLVNNARVRLYNLSEAQNIKVRNIRSKHINELIVIEGIIRQASDVRPQVVNARFECPSCGTIISMLQMEKKFREPSRCSCGRKGGFKLLSKEMVDTQRLVVEESPESLSGGEQPKRINVFVKEDLVEPQMEDKTTPGSRVKVIGILKEVPVPLSTGGLSTRFELAIEVNNLIPLEETFEELNISEEDESKILELAKDPEIFGKLAKSIVPSVWGYEEIKKSLVLQLFGGVKKIHVDGQKRRGDIHILLIGDPGVAKSIGPEEKILYYTKNRHGYRKIRELFNEFGKHPKNLKVLTINQSTHAPEWESVNEIIKHPPEKELIKVTTSHGKSVIATKDHSFITLSGGKIIPIKGEQIKKGTYLPLPINYHKEILNELNIKEFKIAKTNSKEIPDSIKLNEDSGFFFGIFLSEGYIKSEKSISISNKNKKIQEKVSKFAENLNLKSAAGKTEVVINSKSLSNMLKNYCYKEDEKEGNKTKGNISRIKKIPDFAFFAPKEFIKGVISGLFSGDGRFVKDKSRIKGFELITISKKLSCGTSDLLFSIGILNKINKSEYKYKNEKRICYKIYIPSQSIKKFRKSFNFYGREFLSYPKPVYSYNNLIPCGELVYEITKKLGYNSRKTGDRTFAAEMRTIKKRGEVGRLRLRKIIKKFEQKTKEKLPELAALKKLAYSQIIWSKVSMIEKVKKEKEVYDLIIPKTNTFVSNGIGVHNSVTLNFMADISPKGRYVVGKSASGAGLTATVVRDEYLRGWSLEAGAMVLSNKGLVCIDELEKMDATERSSMHEAMEQQTITISKANVQATLRAETSVLAAANPKLGRFDPYQSVAQQIDLPPTLINRFDVIFTLRDIPNKEKDTKIARHVLQEHSDEGKSMVIPREIFRKYVAYSKQRIKPKLSPEAIEEIENFYIDLRNKPVSSDSTIRPIPISARQLEALIRMSEASAKVRLDNTVTRTDAKIAIDIIKYYLTEVGYDYESKTFDIDKISGMTTSKRNKVFIVRDLITQLESRLGKLIPIEEIEKEAEDNLSKQEIEDAITELIKNSIIYEPRSGYVQKI